MRIKLSLYGDIERDPFEVITDDDIEYHVSEAVNQFRDYLYEHCDKAQSKQNERLERLIRFCNTGRIEE